VGAKVRPKEIPKVSKPPLLFGLLASENLRGTLPIGSIELDAKNPKK
jgi:hypothetical protein